MWPRPRLESQCEPGALSRAEWEYKALTDIEILDAPTGRFARLICEHDCGGEMFMATCAARHFSFLEPYAELLRVHQEDPIGIEKPVVPVRFTESGRAVFSLAGARADYPWLKSAQAPRRLPNSFTPALEEADCTSPGQWLKNLFKGS